MVVLVPAELLWLAWAALVALAAALCVLGSEWTAIVTDDFVLMDSVATLAAETTFAICTTSARSSIGNTSTSTIVLGSGGAMVE